MSQILEKGKNKVKCQKFTPNELVQKMLTLINYDNDPMGKTILENSFGVGNFLKEIVTRYIEAALIKGVDREEICKGLERDIYGIELDTVLYNNCVAELNSILCLYSIPAVQWNLFNCDALTLDLKISFDYIIGNPPYISYKEMDRDSRSKLNKIFKSCSVGKFDYCYAFIEYGIKNLNKTGKLVQLIPNNIYKNVFAEKLRGLLIDHISAIYDYPNQKLFEDALTSVSIFLYNKEDVSDFIYYENVTDKIKTRVNRHNLGKKWIFAGKYIDKKSGSRFGDFFHASVAVATLCNNAFIVEDQSINEENLEQEVLKSAVSPRTLRYGRHVKIIFPYKYEGNRLQHFSEAEFEAKFPNATRHLRRFSDKLEKRNSDKKAAWFEYGRSQALAHLNRDKLLISAIITNSIEVYRVNTEAIPFSGIYITVLDDRFSLEDAAKILKSEQFYDYIKGIGVNVNGKSLRISCVDINNYRF